ncbi:MAG: B12-binding domain-containing radical SAM protein [Candidatus Omnitrophica bacterium]|nr:B12-binding domain-containing radical SAM protein [Candidatus Omnitrophota bacterium]MBU1808057.1 B12-binding domain-containing radical SAM protein [Candidatus Omnitrophota bacterium]
MKHKILFIRPPTIMKGTSFIATQFPLNIAGMAAGLLNRGYDVRIWDFEVEPFDESVFERRIKDLSPLIVAISCYTPTIISANKVAALVKKHLKDVVVITGGPHISALPEASLNEFKYFDIGVIGEGDDTIIELADRISQGAGVENIEGIVYRKGGVPQFTVKRGPIKDLDRLPFPARGLLNIPLYRGQSHRGFSRSFLKITEIITSRGCPNRCIFCASDVAIGSGVRFRSAVSVKGEITECVEKFGFNHFAVMDDTFTLKEERLYEICDEFARRKITWNCYGRVWPLSKKMLEMLAGAGCTGITFGVESGSPRILELIKKNITVSQVEDAFMWAKEAGIKLVEADVIIGSHPSETKDDIRLTRRLLARINPDIVMPSIVVPYPGTELYRMMKEKGLISKSSNWDSFILYGREPSWRTENFSSGELMSLQRKMLLNFYFRPSYVFRMLRKMRSPEEVIYWIRGGLSFLTSCIKGVFKIKQGE